jgi:hypothetical protein
MMKTATSNIPKRATPTAARVNVVWLLSTTSVTGGTKTERKHTGYALCLFKWCIVIIIFKPHVGFDQLKRKH